MMNPKNGIKWRHKRIHVATKLRVHRVMRCALKLSGGAKFAWIRRSAATKNQKVINGEDILNDLGAVGLHWQHIAFGDIASGIIQRITFTPKSIRNGTVVIGPVPVG